jgi:rhodanese-related sulfurtransferase
MCLFIRSTSIVFLILQKPQPSARLRLLKNHEYFPLNVKMNKEGYEDFEAVIKRSQKEYSVEELEEIANRSDAIILDVRSQDEFAKGHIPQSIFIGLDGGFAPWAGAVIANVDQPLLLVTPQGREREAITRLSRVGFDHTLGTLKGGFDTWKNSGKETDQVKSITAEEFKNSISEKTEIFDIRKPDEFSSERIPQALSTPLDFINEHLNKFPKQKEFYIYCAGGYRSMIAASILKRRGIHNLLNVELGFKAIKETGIKTTDFICPSTL